MTQDTIDNKIFILGKDKTLSSQTYNLAEEQFLYLIARLDFFKEQRGRNGVKAVNHTVIGDEMYVTTVEFDHSLGVQIVDEILKEHYQANKKWITAFVKAHNAGIGTPKKIEPSITHNLATSKKQLRPSIVEREKDGKAAGVHVEHWNGRQDATALPDTLKVSMKTNIQ